MNYSNSSTRAISLSSSIIVSVIVAAALSLAVSFAIPSTAHAVVGGDGYAVGTNAAQKVTAQAKKPTKKAAKAALKAAWKKADFQKELTGFKYGKAAYTWGTCTATKAVRDCSVAKKMLSGDTYKANIRQITTWKDGKWKTSYKTKCSKRKNGKWKGVASKWTKASSSADLIKAGALAQPCLMDCMIAGVPAQDLYPTIVK